MIQLPEHFSRTIIGVHKEKGEQWLDDFNELIASIEAKWSLRVLPSYSLSYNFVAPVVYSGGEEAVLKLGVPSKDTAAEIMALTCLEGRGMVKLLHADADMGLILLERLKPGNTLKSVADDETAVLIAASVMKKLRAAPPAEPALPTVAGWFQGFERLRKHFNGGTGPFPKAMIEKAELLLSRLQSAPGKQYLLHGDLHHENILSAEREPWLAIDPKGVIGEPEYEIIPFLMNHVPPEQALQATERRIDLFVEQLDLNKERVLVWAYCHALLAAWWHIESDSGGEEACIRQAERFDLLLRS